MKLDPQLGTLDRLGALAGGLGLLAYGAFGDLDASWLRVALALLGVGFLIAGLLGT